MLGSYSSQLAIGMTADGKYDVIVAGAGLAGCLAATTAAKAGANVLLLDRNPESEVGKKTVWGWTCGDAVAKSHLDFVNRKTGITFSRPELDNPVTGVLAISPDMQTKFMFDGEGFILDRPEFEAKLLRAALSAGAHYESSFEVEAPVLEDSRVVGGVEGKDRNGQKREYRAKVVVDALGGISTVLRRKLPENPLRGEADRYRRH
ncbi:FAD-binding protein [Thermogymnomonas acidicola]|uniref:NAD(P)/FAD-dependent oxidoreductase n=1 Tax=Thermogymnomonas acidicola TaxID=399579 RepID=UPI00149461BF|nr:FAD-binding protein [Thermogymnomonas acidicola]